MPDFIKFASTSAESLWKESEDKLRATLDAVVDGSLFDNPAHLDVIRDAFFLHLVRSISAVFVHRDAWTVNRHLAQQEILRQPQLLDDIYYRKYRIYPNDQEARDTAVEMAFVEVIRHEERGAYFRVGAEDKFNRYRPTLAGHGVEIFKAKRGEFLIGDAPLAGCPSLPT